MPDTVGELIKALRKARGLSTEKLASKADVAPSTLYRWQKGKFQPKLIELHAVLAVLEASAEERDRAVALLDAPRSTRVLSAKALKGYVLPGVMPGIGDLLRALRIRRGWTARQLAAELKIATERVSRWETSQTPSPPDRLQELLLLLKASSNEQAALMKYRVVLPLADSLTSLDACEQHLDTLRQQAYGCASSPRDLSFLSLEAHLWPLAQRNPTALRLLVLTSLTHAEWLLGQGRLPEMNRLAERAMEAAQQLRPEWYSVWGTSLRTRFLVHHPKRPDYKQALRLLSPMMDFSALSHQDHALYRDLAEIAGYADQTEQALSFLTRSREYAIARNEQDSLELADIIEARILLRSGKPQAAQNLLGHHTIQNPLQQIWRMLLQTEASSHLDRTDVGYWLALFDQHIEQHNLTHFRRHADKFRIEKGT